jgi:hypothetical protein
MEKEIYLKANIRNQKKNALLTNNRLNKPKKVNFLKNIQFNKKEAYLRQYFTLLAHYQKKTYEHIDIINED